ncbi:MAG: hypothetical protein NUV80_00175 [Candidatus Berkelbacteria bacterium]|nr:hypothetical protein [Candidatus Berkelbacteria bacterium]MCR4306968.1 hypothetical protein [Candidatus Berkelbacteria bacterium]
MSLLKKFLHRHSFAIIGLGAILIILISGIVVDWKGYLSPDSGTTGNVGPTTIRLKSSDHSKVGQQKIALPNTITDTTRPEYADDINTGATKLEKNNTNIKIPRFQFEIDYK